MELGLAGKTALVTGSSRGIGKGIALALAAEGARVMLTGRDSAALDATAREIAALGGAKRNKIHIHVGDLGLADEPQRLADAAKDAFGTLDILVNNAGATKRGDFFALSDGDWQAGFGLKFFGHMRLARAAWPMLKAARGSVLAIVGAGGRTPSADFSIGSTVNAACLALSKALADIGQRDGVQVNAINPGHVETARFFGRLKQHMAETGLEEAAARADIVRGIGATRLGKVEDVAALAAFIVSPRGRWLHGAIVDIDGGQTKTL
jgi:3-oxoacyl-[acyl-carrier protein] reductase